ncbi:MAG: acriflavine resistance protein B [Candidatus Marinimicrobia bacterium]|nr:acriflavine resistance protein B [Candidatus Neomarinimicrobiota bacterium]|tara:strand:+ start:855 stop:4031 length:3177 start_codon:yes stop_codon:yes gene_type:complete
MKGIITWFIDNPVISNLLMILIVVGGFLSFYNMKMEIFPELKVDVITISVVYPGASPHDIEQGICIPIEEGIEGISGIKKVSSSASESYGLVAVEIIPNEDLDLIKEKINSAISSITNFPKDIESPIVTQIIRNSPVLYVSIHGDLSKQSLFNLTSIIKDDLDAIDGIDLTKIGISKTKAIFIKSNKSDLIRHNISMDDIEKAVKFNSLELPAGKIENEYKKTAIRVKENSKTKNEIGGIEIYSTISDSKIRLSDIAKITEGFKNDDIDVKFNNQNSSFIEVFRIGKQNALEISKKVKKYVNKKNKILPSGVKLSVWNDESVFLSGRLNLLIKNAAIGLVLVMIVLSLFLKPKFAFWVSLGIPISFLGALWFFPALDVSINMLSLFTFILVLGIVVDDAIVVGENFYKYKEQNFSSRDAAINGALEVSTPVIFAILTTMATFAPMLFLSGASASAWKIFPLVVIPILFFSLFESLTILPFHLAHSKERLPKIRFLLRIKSFWDSIRIKIDKNLNLIIDFYYKPFLEKCLKNNFLTLSVFLAMFIITIGIIYSGIVKFNFFPPLENDTICAQIVFPDGGTIKQTQNAVNILLDSIKQLELEIDGEINSSEGMIRNVLTVVGAQPYKQGTSGRGSPLESSFNGSNLGEVQVELSPAEYRSIKSSEVASLWRDRTSDIPGLKELNFAYDLFSAGEDIKFQFNSNDINDLSFVVDLFKRNLNQYPGVNDIIDNNNKGNKEIIVKMLPEAKYYGVDALNVSRFIRNSFQGKKIMSIQRGRDEVEVILEYTDNSRTSVIDLQNLLIKTKFNTFIPLKAICSLSAEDSYTSINRVDRKRSMFVSASVDKSISNSNEIINSIEKNDMKDILSQYPSVSYSLIGQQKEQSENLESLFSNYLVALIIVFMLLAIPFKSYYQPFIVMTAIPYGIIGAVLGHLFLNMDFSILSMLGIAALSGIVVNDSLVMMDYINRNKLKYGSYIKAALSAGPVRFRPILLTSLTTFMGVLPLIFEKSIQAKFLVPMAVSLGFGVLFSTAVTLILVPTSYVTLEKLKELLLKKSKSFMN